MHPDALHQRRFKTRVNVRDELGDPPATGSRAAHGKEQAAREAKVSPTLAVEASLSTAHTQTRLKLTGANPGGHNLYVIAERPDGQREEVGEVTWDGERHDIILPFVARQIQVLSSLTDPNRVETVIDVLQDFIEDNIPPPEPEPDPEPESLDGSYQVSDVATPREVPPEEKYQESPPPKDPNMPVKPVDPRQRRSGRQDSRRRPRGRRPGAAGRARRTTRGTGALEAQATRLEAQAAIKRGEGDTEAAERLEAEAATTRGDREEAHGSSAGQGRPRPCRPRPSRSGASLSRETSRRFPGDAVRWGLAKRAVNPAARVRADPSGPMGHRVPGRARCSRRACGYRT